MLVDCVLMEACQQLRVGRVVFSHPDHKHSPPTARSHPASMMSPFCKMLIDSEGLARAMALSSLLSYLNLTSIAKRKLSFDYRLATSKRPFSIDKISRIPMSYHAILTLTRQRYNHASVHLDSALNV